MAVTRAQVLTVVRQIEPDPAAARTLGPDALRHLRPLIRGDDVSLARRAASVAAKIPDRRAVAVVDLAAESEHPEVRVAAASELWRLAEHDVTRPAMRLLGDPDPVVRRRALRSIGAMPAEAPPKPAVLRRVEAVAARDAHPANRALATLVVRRATGEERSADDIRAALAAGLAARDLAPLLGPGDLEAVASLTRARDARVAATAVALASAVDPRRSVPILERAASDRRAGVRAAVATVAARVPGGKRLLSPLVEDSSPEVRATAFMSAARARLPGLKEIASRLGDDPDERVRSLAEEFLRGAPNRRPR